MGLPVRDRGGGGIGFPELDTGAASPGEEAPSGVAGLGAEGRGASEAGP